jgi:hypothetical protein
MILGDTESRDFDRDFQVGRREGLDAEKAGEGGG